MLKKICGPLLLAGIFLFAPFLVSANPSPVSPIDPRISSRETSLILKTADISKNDLKTYKKIFYAIENNRITAARKLIKKLEPLTDNKMIVDSIKDINNIDKEAIKRITGIVQGLKRFVRLDEADLQFADINKELDLTLELIKHETKNKITIIKNYNEIPSIKCYPNMLNQVFMNILINACQSMPEGGTITISTLFENNSMTVSIKDTGTGIDEKIKDRIFAAGTTTKKAGIGTGLGLAISKKIIEKHNGTIDFVSQKNLGTEFIIKIPGTV